MAMQKLSASHAPPGGQHLPEYQLGVVPTKTSWLPSGDHTGCTPGVPAASLLTVPSAAMTAISVPGPNRAVSNAILPSTGENVAPESAAGSLVSRTKPEPSALMRQMSGLPVTTSQPNAILAPSDDQTGDPLNPMLSVTRVGLEPSAAMTYSSRTPSLSLENAIRPPSGDQRNAPSKPAL